MKIIFLICFSALLPACSVYTLTNKTNENIKFKRAGDKNKETLNAGECVELSEYFVGLGSDFPLTIDGKKDVEYKAGSYEIIKLDNAEQSESQYKVSLSDKNPNCSKEGEEKDDEKEAGVSDRVPVCENGEEAKCNSPGTQVACVKKEGDEIGPICLDMQEGKPKNGVNPVCGNTSISPICKEKQKESTFIVDERIKVLCLRGNAVCSEGEFKCIRENNKSVPVCLKDNRKTEEKPYCPGDNGTLAECITNTVVTIAPGSSVICGDLGQNAHCSNSRTRAVCGSIPTSSDTQLQPYCVNENNVRWNIDVLCSNGAIALCR